PVAHVELVDRVERRITRSARGTWRRLDAIGLVEETAGVVRPDDRAAVLGGVERPEQLRPREVARARDAQLLRLRAERREPRDLPPVGGNRELLLIEGAEARPRLGADGRGPSRAGLREDEP